MRNPRAFPAAVSIVILVVCLGPDVGLKIAAAAATPTSIEFQGFDRFVLAVMEEFQIPGIAVGAVRNGKVVLSKGYGYRNVEKGLPVTPRTLMAIGSNGKSVTVTLMGMLSDSGELDWDAPVRKYLPDFRVFDEVATRFMTPTDLVVHRSGIPNREAIWYGRNISRGEIYKRLRFLEPNVSFRQRWQYNNLMYVTAGYLLEQMTGRSWDALVRERIFVPLGMHRSNTSVDAMPASDNYSLPYMRRGKEVVAVPFRNIDNVAPAGSINSSVEEMMHYIQMHIDQGRYEGKQLISREMSKRMQSVQTATLVSLDPGAPNYVELGPGGYGLGLIVSGYRGHKLVGHGGGIDGFVSSMSWMPDDRIGVMVLTNSSSTNPVPRIIERNVYDRLLGLEPADWVARSRKELGLAEKRRKRAREKRAAERVTNTRPSRPLSDFAGTYRHPAYGTVEVEAKDGQLELTLDRFSSKLEHFHFDVFEAAEKRSVPPSLLDGTRVTFTSGPDGEIGSVMILLESNLPEIVFKRIGG